MAVKMPTISEVEHLTMIPTSLGGVPRAMEAHATLPAVISTTAVTRPTHLKRAISRWEGPAATRWRG